MKTWLSSAEAEDRLTARYSVIETCWACFHTHQTTTANELVLMTCTATDVIITFEDLFKGCQISLNNTHICKCSGYLNVNHHCACSLGCHHAVPADATCSFQAEGVFTAPMHNKVCSRRNGGEAGLLGQPGGSRKPTFKWSYWKCLGMLEGSFLPTRYVAARASGSPFVGGHSWTST